MQELDLVFEYIKEEFSDPIFDNSLLDFISGPSKRIRSLVTILYLKSANKEISPDIYNIMAAGEIIHNASLLHDDIIDNANLRRGETTIGAKFSPKISILAGDYLVGYAIEKLLKLKNFEVLEIFKNCTKLMSEAEIQQFFLRGKIPSKDDYLNICRGKTASLFAAILESSSKISGLDSNSAKIFGELFGIYFQIKNDLDSLSAKVDQENNIYTAKTILGIENTLLLLDNYREEMRHLLGVFPESIYKQELEGLFK